MKKKMIGLALSLVAVCFMWSGTAAGLTIDLVAEPATVTMPDATVVDMWGFRDLNDTNHVAGDWKVPVFTTTETDTLTINLTNSLPADGASTLKKPVSVVIPGLLGTGNVPVWIDGPTGTVGTSSASRPSATHRVRSLTYEVDNGAVSPVAYDWATLKPGTYIIQSGTHQQVQVQMGLYAVLIVTPTAAGQAYNATATVTAPQLAYTQEQTLVFGEIDTAFHAAVATDQYGPGKTHTSTMNYHPDYYLINGQPHAAGAAALNVGSASDNILIRLVNTGYETYVPVFQGEYVNVVGEDGNVVPYVTEQYSVELPAGQTKDVILAEPQSGVVSVYDGRLSLTNNGVSGGGAFVNLSIAPLGALVSPNGGEILPRGTVFEVQWLLNPAADSYRLHYFDADGTAHAVANVGNTDTYTWAVPQTASIESGKSFRVAAYSGATAVGSDYSDGTFSIAASQVSPNGGETLNKGEVFLFTWAAVTGADTYRLHYFDADGTGHLIQDVAAPATSLSVTVPYDVLAESGKKFRVAAFSGGVVVPGTIQWSAGTFTVATQFSPNGGEVFTQGLSYPVTWSSIAGADEYRLHYFDSDGTPHLIEIVGAVTDTSWTVPLGASVETGKELRVTPFGGGLLIPDGIQWSDGTFEVIAPVP